MEQTAGLAHDVFPQFVAGRGHAWSRLLRIEPISDRRDASQVAGQFDTFITRLHEDRPVLAQPAHEQAQFKNYVITW